MNKETREFWERLYSLAKSSKKSIKTACEETNISYHTLTSAKYEGREFPSIQVILALADFYKSTLDYLILGKQNQQVSSSLSSDEELVLKEYRTLDDSHKARTYSFILESKQDMFSNSLKKDSSSSGSMAG